MESQQNSSNQNIPNINRKILFFSIGTIAILMLFSGSLYLLNNRSQKNTQNTITIVTPTVVQRGPSPLPTVLPVDQSNLRLVFKKEFGQYTLGVFSLADDGLLSNIYLITAIKDGKPANGYRGEIDSFISVASNPAFGSGNIFDVVNNVIYVLNAQQKKIDTYNLKIETDQTGPYYVINYRSSVNLPPYEIGIPYGISCHATQCDISSAFHLEAGCTMILNTLSGAFTKPVCSGMGGTIEVTPD